MQTFSEIENKTTTKAVAHNVSGIKPTPLKTPALQTQLKIGKPGDEYEQEADRVADQVMSMPESSVQQQPLEEEEEMLQPMLQMQEEEEEEMLQTKPIMQMQPVEEEEELQTKPLLQMLPEEEEELVQPKPLLQMQSLEEEEVAQPKWIQKKGCTSCGENEMPDLQSSTQTVQMSPLSHIESCGGQALPDSSRGFFESRMGYNFKNVRVHTCDSAVQMNQQLGAQAFTYGNNIFFNKGKYSPGSSDGKKLLAHELTHVVQQNGGMKRLDKKRQFYIQPYRRGKTGRQKISSAPKIIQRAAPAAVAAALAIRCAIGAVLGMLIDWGIQRGIAWWQDREYRHDWCSTILSGVLGCLGGMSAAAVEAYMVRTGVRIVSGPILGRILTWLVAQTSVFFPRQSALMLLRLGCINEDQHEAITS